MPSQVHGRQGAGRKHEPKILMGPLGHSIVARFDKLIAIRPLLYDAIFDTRVRHTWVMFLLQMPSTNDGTLFWQPISGHPREEQMGCAAYATRLMRDEASKCSEQKYRHRRKQTRVYDLRESAHHYLDRRACRPPRPALYHIYKYIIYK